MIYLSIYGQDQAYFRVKKNVYNSKSGALNLSYWFTDQIKYTWQIQFLLMTSVIGVNIFILRQVYATV